MHHLASVSYIGRYMRAICCGIEHYAMLTIHYELGMLPGGHRWNHYPSTLFKYLKLFLKIAQP